MFAQIAFLSLFTVPLPSGTVGADSSGRDPGAAGSATGIDASEFARRLWETSEIVLTKHIDPPVRQAMLLGSIRALHQTAGLEPPTGLGRRVSGVVEQDAAERLLIEAWTVAISRNKVTDEVLQASAIDGLLSALPERPQVVPNKEFRVQQQVRGNRYVGIGIQLAMTDDSSNMLPVILNPFPRGPARVAGAKPNDRILSIDGLSTAGLSLEKVVDLLRGDEGSPLSIVVQSEAGGRHRTLEMIRGVVPFNSFSGYRRIGEDEWDFRPVADEPIGYLQMAGILASSLTELRNLAPKLEAMGIRALIIDLRNAGLGIGGDPQHVFLVADELLEEAEIGGSVDAAGVRASYQSGPDCLFRGWPIVLLVNQNTSGAVELLAAALQDNHRAVVVGQQSRGAAYIQTPVELPESLGAVTLRTGAYLRPDGRPLRRDRIEPSEDAPMLLHATSALPNESGGIRPDVMVQETREQLGAWFDWRRVQDLPEPPASGPTAPPRDAVLASAIELIRASLQKAPAR